MAIWTKTLVASETQEKTEVRAEFTNARLAFNESYLRFYQYHKTHGGPFVVQVGDQRFLEFPRETVEGKALALDVAAKRERFYALMAECAKLKNCN